MPLLGRAPPLHTSTAGLLPLRSSSAGIPYRRIPPSSRARASVRASNSDPPQQQQVNLSVLRFTLGTYQPSPLPPPSQPAAGVLLDALNRAPVWRRDPGPRRVVPPAVDRHRLRRARRPQPPPLPVPHARAARRCSLLANPLASRLPPAHPPMTHAPNWLCVRTRRGPRLWGCAWPRSRRRCRSSGGSWRWEDDLISSLCLWKWYIAQWWRGLRIVRSGIWLLLQGADAASRVPLPEGSSQVFIMSENLSAAQKEDLAWASYALLRNTNTTSVVWIQIPIIHVNYNLT